ncbi:MAG: Cu(I)-responsive transcriptional regulator [Telmatospirillum sp.]|nr:Cu(I)-responsive transcriptional regulator [Telmatospirillum sp.]
MTFTIGEAAKASGVSAKMIRYYEDIGLIAPPPRSEAGYRVYSPSDIHTLIFVRRAHDLGFLAGDIGALLDLWRDRDRASAKVKDLVEQHLRTLKNKIADLEAMCRTLERLACCCPGNDRPDCPILEDLSDMSGDAGAPPSPRRIRAPGGVLAGGNG